MMRQVRCECGFTARAATDDEVITLTLVHVTAEHPDLTATAADARSWIELVPDQ